MRGYFRLLRPFTLIAPLLGGFFFSLMSLKGVLTLNNLPLIFLNCFILAMTNATSNIFNQIFDRELDSIIPHKKNRPIPSGEVSLDHAISLGVFLLVVTIALGFTLFGVYYGVLLSIILGFSWMYNSPPLRLRARLFWGNLALATPRGGLGIITAYSAFANPLELEVLLVALAFGVYVFGVNTFKDYDDYEGDLKMGIRNFVTVYGKRNASKIIVPFLYIPFIIFYLAGALHMSPLLIFSLGITLILYRNPELEGKGYLLWALFYAQFSLMIILYTLPYILYR